MSWFQKKVNQVILKDEFNFKKIFTFSQRQNKRKVIDQKYIGDRSKGVSYLVVEKASSSKITTFKKPYKLFAIDNGMTILDLVAYMRLNLKMSQKQSIFLIVGKTIANSNYAIGELYQIYSEPDGFLYVNLSESEVF